jgi:hypothetical protein
MSLPDTGGITVGDGSLIGHGSTVATLTLNCEEPVRLFMIEGATTASTPAGGPT